MAVIGILTEPTGRTRVMFDFTQAPPDREAARIAAAMLQVRPCLADEPEGQAAAPPRGTPQAASRRRPGGPDGAPTRKRTRAAVA